MRVTLIRASVVRQAIRALRRNWIQSSLSILGIAVAVAAFICVIAIGTAGTSRMENDLKNLGNNLVWIEAGSRNHNGVRLGARGTRSLVIADADAILKQVPTIKTLTPNVDGHIQVIYGGRIGTPLTGASRRNISKSGAGMCAWGRFSRRRMYSKLLRFAT